MARPRQFDQVQLLEAAVQCFWDRGYAATSVQDLVRGSGVTAASLYNAFGDKRALPAQVLAGHLVGVLMGLRVLARARPRRGVLDDVVAPALALLSGAGVGAAAR